MLLRNLEIIIAATEEKKLIGNIDYKGIIFLAITLISFLLFIEEGERRDWFSSNFIILAFGINYYLYKNQKYFTDSIFKYWGLIFFIVTIDLIFESS